MKNQFEQFRRYVRNLNWTKTNRFGQNRILKTSYIWLIVVPILARALEYAAMLVQLSYPENASDFTFDLPFTWQLFYLAAVIISIASLIYTIRCPDFVQRFDTLDDFEREGRGREYLASFYTLDIKIDIEPSLTLDEYVFLKDSPIIPEEDLLHARLRFMRRPHLFTPEKLKFLEELERKATAAYRGWVDEITSFFTQDGRTMESRPVGSDEELENLLEALRQNMGPLGTISLPLPTGQDNSFAGSFFWKLHDRENEKDKFYCRACLSFYAVGLVLLVYPMIENLVYVLKASF